MHYFNENTIEHLEHLYKINLINSCSGYKSANLIGTKSDKGIENVAVFSSVTHIGSSPAMLGFFMRPTSVPRNTYENIKSSSFYTINHIHEPILEDAHHSSAKYESSISEFDKTGLDPEYKNGFFAPFVKNAPVQMAMRFVEQYDIKANGTILIIGKIIGLYVTKTSMEEDGFIDLSKGKVAAINGLDAYSIPQNHARFGYQKPKK
ncbi:flavin reductase family protein [Mariniflexile ostreae]|uniref:Flavin reductase family protein n=1 Tax=Mariniflexile ostreae TaxID=1520892 RepID=A0ABV5F7E1_9FLAO